MSFIYNMADTWNAVGTTFNSILMNVSNGAGGAPVGAAASRILNLQANGLTVFDIAVSGVTTINTTTTAIGSLPAVPTGSYFRIAGTINAATVMTLDSWGTAAGNAYYGRYARGTPTAPTATQVDDILVSLSGFGYGNTAYSGPRASILLRAGGAWTDASQPGYISFNTTPVAAVVAVEMARMTAQGYFGLGTTGPNTILEVSTADQSTNRLRLTNTGVGGTVVDLVGGTPAVNNIGFSIYDVTNAATRLNINATGQVGIGTTGQSAQLHTTGSLRFANFGAGAATFDASGNISSVSDERLKNIKGNYKNSLDKLHNINPIIYSWLPESNMETEHSYIGFSAQNVRDTDELLSGENSEGYLSIQDRGLLALLVNSVKELDSKVEKLNKNIMVIES